jgi:hypothetical protein
MNIKEHLGNVSALLLMDGWHMVELVQPIHIDDSGIVSWFWCREYLGSGWFELSGPMESILAVRKKPNVQT